MQTENRSQKVGVTGGAGRVGSHLVGMIEQSQGLSARALQAIAELEAEVVAADGGRLKLNWGMLRARESGRVEDLLSWDAERLIGFLGLYRFGGSIELAGMVAPGARRSGLGSALLDAATALCRAARADPVLLIVPRASTAGRHLAQRRGAHKHHSEHALTLAGDRAQQTEPGTAGVSLRPATRDDVPVIARWLETGFGDPAPEVTDRLSRLEPTLMIDYQASAIGTISLTQTGVDGGIYGFVVDPAWQGRGIGREAVRQACLRLCTAGAQQVGLEVEVDNDRALSLYTSIGFTLVNTEDYYKIPMA